MSMSPDLSDLLPRTSDAYVHAVTHTMYYQSTCALLRLSQHTLRQLSHQFQHTFASTCGRIHTVITQFGLYSARWSPALKRVSVFFCTLAFDADIGLRSHQASLASLRARSPLPLLPQPSSNKSAPSLAPNISVLMPPGFTNTSVPLWLHSCRLHIRVALVHVSCLPRLFTRCLWCLSGFSRTSTPTRPAVAALLSERPADFAVAFSISILRVFVV